MTLVDAEGVSVICCQIWWNQSHAIDDVNRLLKSLRGVPPNIAKFWNSTLSRISFSNQIMHALLLLRLAAPISSWDTLREIANDSVAHQKSISDPEMLNLMNRFEERRLQWVAASNTIEARARKSCVIPQATGWAELEADDFELPLTTRPLPIRTPIRTAMMRSQKAKLHIRQYEANCQTDSPCQRLPVVFLPSNSWDVSKPKRVAQMYSKHQGLGIATRPVVDWKHCVAQNIEHCKS